jgi:single-strand DNA-binding protein
MAEGMNKVIVMGNLGQDPELRSTQGGASVMTLSLAINESYIDANKERQQRTEWVRVVVWGKRAEGLARILRKGSTVLVEGALRTSSYEDRKTGEKRYKTEVHASQVCLAGRGPDADHGARAASGSGARRAQPQVDDYSPDGGIDEIPF